MPNLYVSGMERLCGKVKLQGAKNSALPILAASLIVKERPSYIIVPILPTFVPL